MNFGRCANWEVVCRWCHVSASGLPQPPACRRLSAPQICRNLIFLDVLVWLRLLTYHVVYTVMRNVWALMDGYANCAALVGPLINSMVFVIPVCALDRKSGLFPKASIQVLNVQHCVRGLASVYHGYRMPILRESRRLTAAYLRSLGSSGYTPAIPSQLKRFAP
jgi:hypothetical protein